MSHSQPPYTTQPLAPALGATLHGLRLPTLDEDGLAAIRRELREHLVIAFPGQHLTVEELVAFGHQLGQDVSDVYVRDSRNFKPNRLETWHADGTYGRNPPYATVLAAEQVPAVGGDTLFASMYAAYDALAPELQAWLRRLSAFHPYLGGRTGSFIIKDDPTATEITRHPMVLVHPETNRQALYVNPLYTTTVVDVHELESRFLLDYLFAHLARPEFTCRYRWAPGDVVVWDNRCTLHYPTPDYDFADGRVMHRITIQAPHPSPAPHRSGE